VAVPAPCRRAVSWVRPAAHDPHGPSCRTGTGTLPAVPCRPWAVPKGRAVGRVADPWAVCTPIDPLAFYRLVRCVTTSVMSVRCYGQLKDHAHNRGTSHKIFTIHNIMSILTTSFHHYISLMQKDSKVSSKNRSCLTRHISHPTNKLYLALVDFVTNLRQYCTHHNHYPKHESNLLH
jgi:hypothetical protein